MRRKVTATESLYLSIEASVGSFSITRAIKGTFLTAKPQISAIKEAWNRTCWIHPHFRRIVRKNHWEDMPSDQHPHFRHQAIEIDIANLPHLPKIHCEESAVCLWLFNDGFVFQVAHSITDGAGLTQLIRTFFRVLRSADTTHGELSAMETLSPVNNCDIDERTFARRFVANFNGFVLRWDKKFTNQGTENQKSEPLEAHWAHRQLSIHKVLQSQDIKVLLGLIMVRVTQWMQTHHPNKTIRCMLPVDLRKYDTGSHFDGNLTLPLWLELTGNESAVDLSNEIRHQLKTMQPLHNAERMAFENDLLRGVRNWAFTQMVHWSFRRNRYTLNMVVSFLGRYEKSDYSTGSFQCDTMWSTALFSGISPVQINFIHDDAHIQFHISYLRKQFTELQIEDLFQRIGCTDTL